MKKTIRFQNLQSIQLLATFYEYADRVENSLSLDSTTINPETVPLNSSFDR